MGDFLDNLMGPRRDGNDADASEAESQPATTASERHVGSLIAVENTVASMLDLRLPGGKRTALPYSYLASVDFDPSGAVVCTYASAVVTIKGRDLEAIYTAITNHTALAVVQVTSGFDEGNKGPFVESIVIERGGEQS